ncbi:UDP binding domain-containing protein, partial [Rhizobium sp. SIMBA_035]
GEGSHGSILNGNYAPNRLSSAWKPTGRLNDSIGAFVAGNALKLMLQRKLPVTNGKVIGLGLTFKEDCPNVYNTKVGDIVRGLEDYGIAVNVYDPWIDIEEARHE